MNKNIFHTPVLLNEVIDFLKPKENQNFIDCTVGFGGYAEEILKRTTPGGKLLGIDLDPRAISECRKRLSRFGSRFILVEDNFANLRKIVKEHNFTEADGILFDLGLSSYQLTDLSRGFSYQGDGSLDMRFGEKSGAILAKDIINSSKLEELKNIFVKYGDFRREQARRMAEKILQRSKRKEITKASELKEIISEAVPTKFKIQPILSRIFQSLRIATNQELLNLEIVTKDVVKILRNGGRVIFISYHSLEDRIIKHFFIRESKDCLCPKEIPVCRCGHRANLKIITKKPVIPKEEEVKKNLKSRSAKLRVAEKLIY